MQAWATVEVVGESGVVFSIPVADQDSVIISRGIERDGDKKAGVDTETAKPPAALCMPREG